VLAILAAEQLGGFRMAGELLLHGIKHQRTPCAGGDVAEVAEGGAEVVDGDVGIQFRAGADGVEEVRVMRGEVRAGAFKFSSMSLFRSP
jgi:hypothetical protein